MCALEIEAEAPDLEPHCSHSSELCIAIVITEGLREVIVMQNADPSIPHICHFIYTSKIFGE